MITKETYQDKIETDLKVCFCQFDWGPFFN